MNLTLHKARLQGFSVEDASYLHLDLSSMSASGSKWKNVRFDDCDLALSDLTRASFEDVTFANCSMDAANFRMANFHGAEFIDCSIRHGVFIETVPIDNVVFNTCKMQNSSFYGSTIRSAAFLDCNLHGADLRFIEGNSVFFTGSNLWGVHVQLGCQFWNANFDERQTDLFTAMVARVHPAREKARLLREQSGKQFRVVSRLMDDPEGGTRESTA